jgi:GNAT superfamily N-acetyltransferase
MIVRPATFADLDRCEKLDGSSSTGHIWHIEETVNSDAIAVTFRRTRIPRYMELPYPRSVGPLFEHWKRRECFLVAQDAGSVAGFLDMTVNREQWQGWIEHLMVHRPFRRQGVAGLLLEGAERWARGSELRAINVVVQTKNDPAIRLLVERGYAFRGYVDQYFDNGDLGLVYCLNL